MGRDIFVFQEDVIHFLELPFYSVLYSKSMEMLGALIWVCLCVGGGRYENLHVISQGVCSITSFILLG